MLNRYPARTVQVVLFVQPRHYIQEQRLLPFLSHCIFKVFQSQGEVYFEEQGEQLGVYCLYISNCSSFHPVLPRLSGMSKISSKGVHTSIVLKLDSSQSIELYLGLSDRTRKKTARKQPRRNVLIPHLLKACYTSGRNNKA